MRGTNICPYYQATFYGRREVAKFLLSRNADSTVAATNGCTALDLATLVEETDTELLRLLAKKSVEDSPPEIVMPDNKKAFAPRWVTGGRDGILYRRQLTTKISVSIQ